MVRQHQSQGKSCLSSNWIEEKRKKKKEKKKKEKRKKKKEKRKKKKEKKLTTQFPGTNLSDTVQPRKFPFPISNDELG